MKRIKKNTRAEYFKAVGEIESMIAKYGWDNETSCPFGDSMKFSEILKCLKEDEYENCTKGSQLYLIELANGFMNVLEARERYELAPKVTVISPKGKTSRVTEDMLDFYLENGWKAV